MIISLVGSNSFALRQKANEIISEFIKRHGDLAVEKYDGEEDNAQKIIDGLQSLPFLAKRKMVVIRNGGQNKDFGEQIEQIISSISEATDVVFYESQIDKRTAYFKVLKDQTKLEEFNVMDTLQLAKWLVNEAKNRHGSLGFVDANYLVERLGTNQILLANELDKLLIYSPEITRQNIDLLTEPTPQSKVFELLDAAFSGRKERALKLYDDQRAQKVETQAILAMIAWQLNILAIAKNSTNRELTEVSRDSGIKEYPLRKAKGLADKLTNNDIKKMVTEALEIDWRGKTTSLDMDEALKNYILSL